ncbi:hypothetical protein OEZ60_04475 [Defluviimonas sp. WL0024]|uniref:Flp pilus assembly protein, pilin Flp n=2 Tax=Albidovulum TaxID=205889 RepID=A0ABT3J733_9RHOB|nr:MULTISPECIES: hypothetical protein [Defluviimonas]MCU9847255.1 hypothetical protein [Defluviimonas sp. WL0024]MCW3783476.1 hypothetical protein [Defluviimonas salinarum]
MKFFKLFKKFHNEEDGAVTVDWVVLTAAVVGLAVAALAAVQQGSDGLAGKIQAWLDGSEVPATMLGASSTTP